MLKVGVIGYGYWGPNLVRNFVEVEESSVSCLCDTRNDRLALAGSRYPSIVLTRDVEEVLTSPEVDAVALATPVSTHFDLALRALKSGKHVLVEKPLAETSEKCERLIAEAEKRRLLLMVDHTFFHQKLT